jgi:hypothetical protein
MNDMIFFTRRSLGGRQKETSGLLVSPGKTKNGDRHISFRLTEDVLSRLRWIEGDLVVAGISRNGSSTGVCKMRRVPTPKDGGCKLSSHGKQKAKNLVVRFTINEEEHNKIFCDDNAPYAGELVRVDDEGNAVFSVSFS